MTRQNISTGTAANDGTGDTLRSAGVKINSNFAEVYTFLGGNSSTLSSQISLEDSAVVFEGAAANNHEMRLTTVEPSADRQIQLPNASGIVTLNNATQTLTNKTLTSPAITTPSITTAINDANDNEIIKFTATGSAVNEITVVNSTSTNAVQINATGTATNLNLNLNAKGTGSINLSKAAFSSTTVDTNAASIVSGTLIIGNKSAGSTLTLSLLNGTTVGEYKIFTNKGSDAMEVTPVTFRGSQTKFTLAQFDGCTCIWDGSAWFLVGNQGEVTVA
jgi:hypothetical protein